MHSRVKTGLFLLLLTGWIGITSWPVQAQQNIVDQFQRGSHTFGSTTLKYRLFVPGDDQPDREYPLVLALHGSGERGNDNERHIQVHRLATSWADPANQAQYPAFVLAPQLPLGQTWAEHNLETIIHLIDSLATMYNLDPDRMYVTGLSLGGFGTWEMIFRFPDRFAAAIPMSGGGDPARVANMGPVSIWNFHGRQDNVVPIDWSTAMIKALESSNRVVGYTHCNPVNCDAMTETGFEALRQQHHDTFHTEYERGGHIIWEESYDHPWLFPWVFAQHRKRTDAVTLTNPNTYTRLSDVVPVQWQTGSDIDSVEIWFNPDFSLQWQFLGKLKPADLFEMDTNLLPDAAFGRFRVFAKDADGFVVGSSTSSLVAIDNAPEGVPFIRLEPISETNDPPLSEESLTLSFLAGDPEQDSLNVQLYYSADGGTTFGAIYQGLVGSNTELQFIEVSLKDLPNSDHAVFRIEADDGTHSVSDQSELFAKSNPRTAGGLVDHVQGPSAAAITIHFIDETELTHHTYLVTFRQETDRLVYDVVDRDTGNMVVEGATELDGTEGPYFDGIRLVVEDLDVARVDLEHTGWNTSTMNLEVQVSAPVINLGGRSIQTRANPADYQVQFFDDIVGQSHPAFGVPSVPMTFQVHNLSEDRATEVVFFDLDGDANASASDFFYILEPDSSGRLELSWRFTFNATDGAVQPGDGDEFLLVTEKPLTPSDQYTIVADPTVANDPLPVFNPTVVLDQNYPNPVVRHTTIGFSLNQPERVTLELFDVQGRRVRVLLNNIWTPAGQHNLSVSTKGLSNGIYLYRLQTGDIMTARRLTILR